MTDPTANAAPEAPLASEEFFWLDRCQHHWVLAPADGPTSIGVCKRCGAEREFSNNPEAVLRQSPALATGEDAPVSKPA